DDALDVLFRRQVGGDLLDVITLAAQLLSGRRQLVRTPGRDGQRVSLLTQQIGDREADPARSTGDESGAIRHGRASFRSWTRYPIRDADSVRRHGRAVRRAAGRLPSDQRRGRGARTATGRAGVRDRAPGRGLT